MGVLSWLKRKKNKGMNEGTSAAPAGSPPPMASAKPAAKPATAKKPDAKKK